jgi:hypothetical protein
MHLIVPASETTLMHFIVGYGKDFSGRSACSGIRFADTRSHRPERGSGARLFLSDSDFGTGFLQNWLPSDPRHSGGFQFAE